MLIANTPLSARSRLDEEPETIETLAEENSRLKSEVSRFRQLANELAVIVLAQRKAATVAITKDSQNPEVDLQSTIRALEDQIIELTGVEQQLIRSKEDLKRLSRHAMESMENDRRRLAGEVKDGIGASLAAIKYLAEEKQLQLGLGSDELTLKPIIAHLTRTIKETKSISARLRPSALDDLGLYAALAWYYREFSTAAQSIRIEHRGEISEDQIPEDCKIVIYRLVQEALINAAKHSRATRVSCSLDRQGDYVRLTVEDNGIGFDPRDMVSSDDPISGYGLQSMRERTEICGGSFTIDSRKGEGTRVTALLPLQHSGEPDL